jgi:glutamate-ammonia-ligase adenylyltransferase
MNPLPTDYSFFKYPDDARTNVERIAHQVPDSHLLFLNRLFSEIQQHPVPDEVLGRFERLTGSAVNKSSFYKMLCSYPPIIARLVRLFSCSRFLGEIIIRDFQYTYFLVSPELYCPATDRNTLRQAIESVTRNSSYSIHRKMDALRGVKRLEILKIGIRDYILNDPFETTARSISILADELIQAVINSHYDLLREKYGEPHSPFAVVALGKLGGLELNYSSDIDLMFVYAEEGATSKDHREISYHEFFNQLCTDSIASIARDSSEGLLYRVDARLRPDGDSGPLARSVPSFLHYYESRGQLWERQMLIKARIVAGDLPFGNHFLEQLTPFIYPKTLFESPLSEIARMKWRIEEEKLTGAYLDIKIHSGGIRDIEFIVQALQLINGGRCLSVRTGTTLMGIRALFENGFLNADENELLSQAYIFYRTIEHLLQIEENTQTHSLSGDESELEKIAFLLAFKSTEVFRHQLENHFTNVRIIYDAIFQTVRDATHTDDLSALLISEAVTTKIEKRIRSLGFESGEVVSRAVKALALGYFPKMYSNSTRKLMSELLPALMQCCVETPNPDHTLANFERIVSHHPFIDIVYRTLMDQPSALKILVRLASFSNFFTHVLCEKPSSIDYLLSHYETWQARAEYDPGHDWKDHKNLYIFKNMEWIKLACQADVKSDETILRQLTQLADHILRYVFEEFFSGQPVALIGLGKLGGMELSYKSDLDIVLVCRDGSDVDAMIAQGKAFLNKIAQITPSGKLYDIDARLRPEGSQAPLVVTESRYREYLQTRAMFWERQALIKARPVCGDAELAYRIIGFFQSDIYEKPFTAHEIDAITAIRERQIAEKFKAAENRATDIKFSRGALLDIEYLVQALQMKYHVKNANTLDAIRCLEADNRITDKQQHLLHENYLFLRKLEKYNYLAFERKSHKIPNDEKQLAFLAKFCKLESGTHLLERLSSVKEQNESIFFTLMRESSHGN